MQLWSPLAHSVGVARTFAELDSLAYASLFPDSLARLRQWYSTRSNGILTLTLTLVLALGLALALTLTITLTLTL